LLVEARGRDGGATDKALDKDIHFGETYEYQAQRVARVLVDGQTKELSGPLSAPVEVEAADVFPPAAPVELAAVAVTAEDGGEAAIDLSWQANTEADLTGYIVYRREGDGDWQRISPAGAVVGPAFHDAHVQAGHSYRYAVSAIDEGGHESGRSAEAEEMVPGS
jgi:fibronectin type 3 domain-containing protein